jgi:hypothetical protein
MLLRLLLLALLLSAGTAHAGSDTTRYSLDRLEEILDLRIDDGRLTPQAVLPAILVSAHPHYEGSQDWYATRVIELLEHSFGDGGLRLCEACMAPRAYVVDGSLTYQTGPVGLDEVIRLDEQTRGEAQPARSAIWVDEHRGGVAIRIVDLGTGRVLFAQNVDPYLVENANTRRMYTLSEELDRRARGDSITQAFVDLALYPGQHISIDWTEQWGATNANLSGVTLSVIDPVVGLGASHYRCVDLVNILVGGKVLVSLPTAIARGVGDTGDVIDPIVTGVAVVRVPFGRSNYGAVLTASTNGQIALGISLMNISLLPVLP